MSALRLVLVEDNPADQVLFRKGLQNSHSDTNLQVFADGESALAFLKQATAVDLLVLDINLPGMGGLETLRAVRKLERFRQLPIVFISGALDPLVETAEADVCLRKSERLGSYFALVRVIDEYGRSMKRDPSRRADHLATLRASLA